MEVAAAAVDTADDSQQGPLNVHDDGDHRDDQDAPGRPLRERASHQGDEAAVQQADDDATSLRASLDAVVADVGAMTLAAAGDDQARATAGDEAASQAGHVEAAEQAAARRLPFDAEVVAVAVDQPLDATTRRPAPTFTTTVKTTSWVHRGAVEDATTQLSRHKSCVFCGIVAGKRPAKVVYEDARYVAFHDIHPAGTFHYLVIPKHHIRDINALRPDDHDVELRTCGSCTRRRPYRQLTP